MKARKATAKTEVKKPHLYSERRRKTRKAPGFASRHNTPIVDGLTKAELVQKYGKKVKLIALRIANRLGHAIEVDDLMSMGYIGLMNAADRYDSSHGTKFETYAEFRIRGTIFDEIRKQDWVPRSARDRAKLLSETESRLQAEKSRKPTDKEMSIALGVTLKKYYQMRSEIGGLMLLNFPDTASLSNQAHAKLSEAVARDKGTIDPFNEVCRKDAKKVMEDVLKKLNENERTVISCYYFRGLNQSEIAQILELTEARISQIHSKAILHLKECLEEDVTSVKKLFLLLFNQEKPEYLSAS